MRKIVEKTNIVQIIGNYRVHVVKIVGASPQIFQPGSTTAATIHIDKKGERVNFFMQGSSLGSIAGVLLQRYWIKDLPEIFLFTQ